MKPEVLLSALSVALPVLVVILVGWANLTRRLERIAESLIWLKRELRTVEDDSRRTRDELHKVQLNCAACHAEHSQHGGDT